MTDDDQKDDEVEPPMAAGLDEWHTRAAGVDAAEAEKSAKSWHDERIARYYESEGRDQIGGFVSPSPFGRGRQIDWTKWPRMWDWR